MATLMSRLIAYAFLAFISSKGLLATYLTPGYVGSRLRLGSVRPVTALAASGNLEVPTHQKRYNLENENHGQHSVMLKLLGEF